MADQESELEKIGKRLQSIELRLSRLESALSIAENENTFLQVDPKPVIVQPVVSELSDEEGAGLESRIGRFGLAWLGNIVLLLGIAFLTQYLMTQGHRLISVLLGYTSAAAIYYLSFYLKKANIHLAFMLKMNALMLLFYITLTLHFFSSSPLLSNKAISIVLLLVLVALQVYISIREKSQALGSLSVVFALITAVVSDKTNFMLPMVVLTAAGTIYYFYRFKWQPLLIVTIVLSYIIYFMWLFSNPLLGHTMQFIPTLNSGVIYLFLLGTGFSLMSLLRKNDSDSDDFIIGVIIVNGVLFTLLLILVGLRFYNTNYVPLFTVITICCLIYSTILKSTSTWNFATAFFALYGFMAMSISLYGIFGLPGVYLVLSIQSLIVVSMALWFRNRLMVIMNSLLFLSILLIYLFSSKPINGVNFSFALVALITARIINWKRDRLKIETDLIRNLYLFEGFIMVLYALYHAVPQQFVTLSWTIAALLYFLLSFLLKNVKYRYLALGTMICAAFYLFIVDLARIEIIYRILAFLFLAAISIGISMYYSSRIKKSDD
jgi:hypothetical protein